jgi:hypothetical protein
MSTTISTPTASTTAAIFTIVVIVIGVTVIVVVTITMNNLSTHVHLSWRISQTAFAFVPEPSLILNPPVPVKFGLPSSVCDDERQQPTEHSKQKWKKRLARLRGLDLHALAGPFTRSMRAPANSPRAQIKLVQLQLA